MTPTTLLGGSAIAGTLVAAWDMIKAYLQYIWGLVFDRCIVTGETLQEAVLAELLRRGFRKVGVRNVVYMGLTEFVRPVEAYNLVIWRRLQMEYVIMRRGFCIITVSKKEDLTIRYIRGTFDHEQLLVDATALRNDWNAKSSTGSQTPEWRRQKSLRGCNRYCIHYCFGNQVKAVELQEDDRPTAKAPDTVEPVAPDKAGFYLNTFTREFLHTPLKWSVKDLGEPVSDDAYSNLYYSSQVQSVIEDTRRWRDSEEWHKKHGVPWRRGYLLHGRPGTGKTAFVRAVGMDLNMPICVMDIGTMSNQDLSKSWRQAGSWSPCIILIEDIDSVFHGRENRACHELGTNKLSFDALLNCIDGVQNSPGVMLMITTNDITKVDPALGQNTVSGIATRPGRIDRIVEFPELDADGRQRMARRILGDFPVESWNGVMTDGVHDTGAQFQERCRLQAMKLFWEKT